MISLEYIVVLATAIFFICVLLYLALCERKRKKELKKVSFETGFTYSPAADIELPDLELFRKGHARSKSNLLTTSESGITWSIFDYHYSVGRRTRKQTVVMAQLDRELPEFSLSQEYFYHRIGEIMGFKDIDFEEYPEFSQKYRLKGKDENRIRQLFTPRVILTISQQMEGHVEAKGNFIIVYTPDKRVKAADLYEFFQKTIIIVNLFK